MATQTVADSRIPAIVDRVLDGRLTLEQVRASKPDPATLAEIERQVTERQATAGTPDVLDALIGQAAPVVRAVRHGGKNEFYDLTDSGIQGTQGRRYNWIPRPIVDRLIAAADGSDAPLAEALAAAQLAFESGQGVELRDKVKRASK